MCIPAICLLVRPKIKLLAVLVSIGAIVKNNYRPPAGEFIKKNHLLGTGPGFSGRESRRRCKGILAIYWRSLFLRLETKFRINWFDVSGDKRGIREILSETVPPPAPYGRAIKPTKISTAPVHMHVHFECKLEEMCMFWPEAAMWRHFEHSPNQTVLYL